MNRISHRPGSLKHCRPKLRAFSLNRTNGLIVGDRFLWVSGTPINERRIWQGLICLGQKRSHACQIGDHNVIADLAGSPASRLSR
jgi:hypothetical protein